jgi:hypothetical protein
MALESLLEIIPSDSTALLHSLEIIPPHQGLSSQLQSCEVGFVLLRARHHEGRELGLDRFDPSFSFQGVFRLGKGRWLHPNELSLCGDLIRPLMIGPMWWPSVHLLSYLLLRLQDLV